MIAQTISPDWKERLSAEVGKLRGSPSYCELTLNRLKELVKPPSEQALTLALLDFVSVGGISVGYRVVSPTTHASLGVYRSPFEIPEQLLDDSTGEYIEVDRFQDVEAVYTNEARFGH
ncbi:hypothetical protein SAMN05216227_101283 [Pseudorhodobacter antarcticus]|uniref:Uncharacterized protein n=1 Tax=Pseudorhodobacter antarcticus TaxID=1077947 RepID=A0A1H8G0H0_9RHOB|nr:hypothetical protein SAMN05216227_101283 [Pseudorhodobacter antarcticus]